LKKVGDWWLVIGDWWLVIGDWWLVVGRLAIIRGGCSWVDFTGSACCCDVVLLF
jgi:hypothetical protein